MEAWSTIAPSLVASGDSPSSGVLSDTGDGETDLSVEDGGAMMDVAWDRRNEVQISELFIEIFVLPLVTQLRSDSF